MKHIFTLKKCIALVLSVLSANLIFAQQFYPIRDTQVDVLANSSIAAHAIISVTPDNEKYMHDLSILVNSTQTHLEVNLKPIHSRNISKRNHLPDAPYYVYVSSENVCSGDSIDLWATCTNGTVLWYLNATSTNPIGTGAPLTIYPINNNVYYAACEYDFETSNKVPTNQVIVSAKPSMPMDVMVNKTTVCRGSEVVLSGSCSDGRLVWFTNEFDSDTAGVGTNLSVIPLDDRSYFAACLNGYCISHRVATNKIVIISVPDAPTQVSVDKTEICGSNGVTLSATCGIGSSGWYNTAAGGAVLDGGGTQYPTENGIYYCACINNMCESPRIATMEIKVTPQPSTPTSVIVNKTSICKGDNVVLSATCTKGTATWYAYLTGPRNYQGQGSTLTVKPDSTTAYFAACENGICVSERVYTEVVIVNDHPDTPTNVAVNYTEVCSGSPVSLSATFNKGVLKWYTSASGGTSIGTGTNLSHSPNSNTIYYAACENGGCATNRIATTELKIRPKPNKPTIAGNAIICNGESITLIASESNPEATCHWSNSLTGFSVNISPTSNANYRVSIIANNCSSDSSDVFSITVNPLPKVPTITTNNPAICKGGSALLTGQASNASDNFYWSTPVQANNSNGTNKSIRVVTEPGIYKGWSESVFGCVSAEKSIIILQATNCNGQNFIDIMPEKPAICPNKSIILSATGCSGTITWTDGNSSYTGTFIKVSPSVTTSYMAQCSTGGMASTDVVVAATNAVVTNNIATGVERIKAVLALESSRNIGEPDYTPAPNVSFEAGRSILLKPGFVAERHSTFKAEIKACN